MNFLAHAYLSFKHAEILVGNMISDFVKGKKKFDYTVGILNGINLHRAIDAFTDEHKATKAANEFFKPSVRLYAGAFTDVVYDHFLATDITQFSTDDSLQAFAEKTYATLNEYKAVMPEKFAAILPFMQTQNWLYNYNSIWGTQKSFGGVVRRANYLESSESVFAAFEKNYTALQHYYHEFFPSLKEFAFKKWQEFNEVSLKLSDNK